MGIPGIGRSTLNLLGIIYEHDKAGQLIKQKGLKGETTLSEITYTYDEAGNVVSKEESTEAGAIGNITSACQE